MVSKGVDIMDDLVFKNIPAGGFDTETGFADRVSNPSLSRKNAFVNQSDISYSTSEHRFSDTSPSRRTDIQSDEQSTVQTCDSRMSNPTPTRRRSISSETKDSFSNISDFNSRLSNPTQTRRIKQSEKQVASSFGAISDIELSRASNPTTRRRINNFTSDVFVTEDANQIQQDISQMQIIPENSAVPEMTENLLQQTENIPRLSPDIDSEFESTASLSFASVDDPYGVKENEVKISEPVRKPFESEEDKVTSNLNNNRMSNYVPTHRK